MKALNILLAGAGALMLASCANTGQMDMRGPKLVGGEWVAIGDNTALVTDAIKSTAVFDGKGGVSGTGGCNGYSAKIDLGPMFGHINASEFKAEEKACEEKVEWQEDIVLGIIRDAQYYGFNENGELTITAKDGSQLLLRRTAG